MFAMPSVWGTVKHFSRLAKAVGQCDWWGMEHINSVTTLVEASTFFAYRVLDVLSSEGNEGCQQTKSGCSLLGCSFGAILAHHTAFNLGDTCLKVLLVDPPPLGPFTRCLKLTRAWIYGEYLVMREGVQCNFRFSDTHKASIDEVRGKSDDEALVECLLRLQTPTDVLEDAKDLIATACIFEKNMFAWKMEPTNPHSTDCFVCRSVCAILSSRRADFFKALYELGESSLDRAHEQYFGEVKTHTIHGTHYQVIHDICSATNASAVSLISTFLQG